jgi:hypothetical protein
MIEIYLKNWLSHNKYFFIHINIMVTKKIHINITYYKKFVFYDTVLNDEIEFNK